MLLTLEGLAWSDFFFYFYYCSTVKIGPHKKVVQYIKSSASLEMNKYRP